VGPDQLADGRLGGGQQVAVGGVDQLQGGGHVDPAPQGLQLLGPLGVDGDVQGGQAQRVELAGGLQGPDGGPGPGLGPGHHPVAGGGGGAGGGGTMGGAGRRRGWSWRAYCRAPMVARSRASTRTTTSWRGLGGARRWLT